MKTKLLALTIVLTMVLTVFCNIPVKAANGPSDEYAFIAFGNMEGYKEIYSEGEIYNDAMEGATYDLATNTLTLENVNTNMALETNKMGDDFKVKLVGENSVAMLCIYGDNYGGCLTITGDGTLTVDTSKFGVTIPEGSDEEMNAITFYAENTIPVFTVEDTATVNIKAYSSVIKIIDTPNSDGSKAIVLKNGQNISSNIKTAHYSYTIPVEVKCAELSEEENPSTFKIYTKDGRKYPVLQNGEQYDVRLKPIVYVEGLDKYYFEYTYQGDYNVIFNSEEQLLSVGYEATEEEMVIEGNIYPTEYLKLKNKKGDEFVGYYTMNNNEFHFYVYDVTDYEITLSNGETCKVVTENTEYENALEEASSEDDIWLEVIRQEIAEDNYNIWVNLQTLNIPAGQVQEEPVEEPEETDVVKVEAVENTTEDLLAKEEVGKLINAIVKEDEGTVEGIDAELAEKIREKVEDGETIYVEVVAKEVKAEDIEKDANAVEEKVKEGKVAAYFDIDIIIKTEDEELGTVTSLQNKIKLTLDIPENLPKVEEGYKRTFKVVRVHDGKAEELATTISGNKVTFESDLFSTYALTYEDTKVTKNPKTGDMIVVYFVVLAVSVIGLGVTLTSMKKQD